MSDSAIRPEDTVPVIDYTLTELDGVTHSTQERVCKGKEMPRDARFSLPMGTD